MILCPAPLDQPPDRRSAPCRCRRPPEVFARFARSVDNAAHNGDAKWHHAPQAGCHFVGKGEKRQPGPARKTGTNDLQRARGRRVRDSRIWLPTFTFDGGADNEIPNGVADARDSSAPKATADLMVPWNAGPPRHAEMQR